jgi:hypothetical protein
MYLSNCFTTGNEPCGPDGDNDGLITSIETNVWGTSPSDADTDNDGCSDGEESGVVAIQGGLRDPDFEYDFYDVNGTKRIDAADIALVRAHFNGGGPTPPQDEIYDRSTGAALWAPGPPNNVINATDIGLVRASAFHDCIPGP